MRPWLCLMMVATLAACDDSDDSGGGDSDPTGGSSATETSDGSDGSGSGTPAGDPPPTDPDALLTWLEAGSYTSWPAESEVHPSAGPHFGDVRTFFTPSLVASFEAGNTEHPVDVASVKELYGDSSDVRGWAVMVKVPDDGGSWYWYEYFDDRVVASGNAIALCESCHDDGVDLVLTPFPLE